MRALLAAGAVPTARVMETAAGSSVDIALMSPPLDAHDGDLW